MDPGLCGQALQRTGRGRITPRDRWVRRGKGRKSLGEMLQRKVSAPAEGIGAGGH